MKKLNLICASIATLFAVGAANAGTAVSTATKIAVENFGGSAAAQDTLAVLGAPISYSMSTITAVNSGSTVYFTVRLTGGKFAAAPAAAAFTFGGQACIAGAATTANPQCAVTASTDLSTIKVAVTTAASYTLGLGAFTWTPVAADINAVNTTLNAAGGAVTASVGLVTLNPAAIEATDTQATIDAPLATGTLATGVKAVGGAIAASTYDGKIDLTASPAGSAYTTATGGSTQAVLGSATFTNVANANAKRRDGTANYTLLAGSAGAVNTGVSVVVTPAAGQAFPVGSILKLSSTVATVGGTDYPTCVGTLTGSASGAITALNSTTAKTLTTTDPVVTATPIFVCMSAPSATNTASPIQASLAATVAAAAPADSIGVATGGGYSLGYNGSAVEVTSYWPGALDAVNYKGYLKITNTGSVAAAVAGQHRDANGALVGTSLALNVPGKLPNGLLAPGQSVLLSTKEIDAVLGANPSGMSQGRVRLTAPTNGLRVQSLLQTGADAPIEYSTSNGI